MNLEIEKNITLAGIVSHQFLSANCSVQYPQGISNAVLINDRVLIVIKKAEDVFHDNASQFGATQKWIDHHELLSLRYSVFVACYCKNENRFCVLTWSEFQNMRAERLKSFGYLCEAQFPFRVEVTSKKGFRAFALGGGRKSKKVGLVKKSTGLITTEIKRLIGM